MLNLEAAMHNLGGQRPIFHSEADFQHALAMQIFQENPSLKIRLEYRPLRDERIYVDPD